MTWTVVALLGASPVACVAQPYHDVRRARACDRTRGELRVRADGRRPGAPS